MLTSKPSVPKGSTDGWLNLGPGWLFASIRDAVVVVEPDSGRIVLWNPSATELFGHELATILGRPLHDVVTDLEHTPQWLAVNDGVCPRDPFELFARHHDGHDVSIELTLSRLESPNDGGVFIVAIIRDVSERRQSEEERFERVREQVAGQELAAGQRRAAVLADASRLLDASLDYTATLQEVARVAVRTMADWCIVHLLDEDGSIRWLALAHGDPAKEAVARELQARYPATEGVARVLKTGLPEFYPNIPESQRMTRARDPEHLRLLQELDSRSVMIVPLAARGRMLGAVSLISTQPGRVYGDADLAIAEELARRCAHAVDNARVHQEAQVALKARDRFVQIASHELRTPIARVKGYAEMLLAAYTDGDLNNDMLERSLKRIDHASNRLTNLVRDLLDVSRMSAGTLPLRLSSLDISELVRDVASRYQEQLPDGGQLRVDIVGAPGLLAGDPDRLEQVLTNLLDTAVKYSPEGAELLVRLQRKARGVLLEIQDRGIGLPTGAAERIFEPFSRASNAEIRQITGMGLGLFICRNIVEQHRGRIWASSQGEGQGVLMSVWLPQPGAALQSSLTAA
jgi:PAS domain S-box-containing protein